jgi:glycolate oxidase iron-sulfur subunit
MQHNIPVEQLAKTIGPQIHGMARAVEACVHCGFCLPTCPTYQVLGQEMDSPRGRILLMKAVLEGELSYTDVQLHIDRCLGCLACVTACPSGVKYGELLAPFRSRAQGDFERSPAEKLQRRLIHETLPYPGRFRAAAALGRAARPLAGILPGELSALLAMLPERLPEAEALPELVPAEGVRRARVALLVGCVQQILAPEINRATLRVLAKNGVEVVIPKGQGCCGALALHSGDFRAARALAQHNMVIFPADVDAIVTNAAGCGSGMKDYAGLFSGTGDGTEDTAEQAAQFVAKVKDVSAFLAELGLLPPVGLPEPLTVAYHDACHLAHAQGITAAPRQLLSMIPNLTLVEIPDGAICCGSAGSYNLEQPEIAAELGRRKAQAILSTGARAVVMGNIGCMVQIGWWLEVGGRGRVCISHIMELLEEAY